MVGFVAEIIMLTSAVIVHKLRPARPSKGQWSRQPLSTEGEWGIAWDEDPCSCRGAGCPQCDVTINFQIFLKVHVLLVVLCTVCLIVSSLPLRRRWGAAVCRCSSVAAASVALWDLLGPFAPMPFYDLTEPFCRDDDCAMLFVHGFLCGIGGLCAGIVAVDSWAAVSAAMLPPD